MSSTGRAGLTTSGVDAVKKSLPSAARITRTSPSYSLGPPGSLSPASPSLEEFGTDTSTKRVVVRQSPSRTCMEYGPSKVSGEKRNWQGNPKPQVKVPATYNYSGGIDLRGPRALISAYGMDEREKHLNHKHHKGEELEPAEQNIVPRAWQNTEEEEFDWKDMTTSLPERKQSTDSYSSLPPQTGRQNVVTNHAARLVSYSDATHMGLSIFLISMD